MLNRITIHGYLGRDPELKSYKDRDGQPRDYVTMSVGVSRRDNGTDWFDAIMFGNRAKVIDKFFQKGSQIILSGRMQSDVYEKEGQKRKGWKLIADDFDFCDSKESPRGSNNQTAQDDIPDSWEQFDDDIPFN